ncbi:MAG: hypothetical protein QOF32_1536 [Gammaproteobacteria bacterium]|jgi:hypothetical protein|nr:hypothetical protein [Gammaproteobacteria bacterium]
MSIWSAIRDPLQGKTSLGKVIWGYGLLGSVLYGAVELFLNPANELVMRAYVIGGLLFSIYVTVATYQCAVNCRSIFLRRFVRVSAVISLLLLPLIAYLDLTGALTLVSLGEQ